MQSEHARHEGLGKMDRNLLMCTSVDLWKPAFLNPPGGFLKHVNAGML